MKHVTQWFFDEKPVHNGVYQRHHFGEVTYSYWDGKRWYLTTESPDRAERHGRNKHVSNFQNIAWRGLCK